MKRIATEKLIGPRLLALAVGIVAFTSSANTRNNAEAGSSSAAQSPRTVKFRATAASGLFGKTLSLRGVLVGETEEREFARIRYPAFNQPISNRDWITVEGLSAAHLQLDIDPQFAMPGIHLHMRSDDPATSHYMFHKVGEQWIQAPRATKIDVFSYAGCGLTQQSWEDGGDFHHQDFFFEVDSGPDCAVADASSPSARGKPSVTLDTEKRAPQAAGPDPDP
ncbi:hypothetical protein MesoLj113c_08460 [Mesorhizobium sp. 113-3-9]|uniref:hypothetical protein n=1 Tax=Mesorhizobium sp. 113-3-9 TaxID=2744517 RepID=UPI001928EBE2|nr:hypothetical protein [Mesorhizobium sp. 113-3-9]BCG84736.1 hypothetical protein MesoLj113c_08460 [Mesorhizobium sp. 113-3-9]